MLKKGVMALIIVVAISTIIIGVFAISNNNNPSNIHSNLLAPLNTSSANSNLAPANGNSNPNRGVNTNNVLYSDIKTNNKNIPESDSVKSTSKLNTIHHLSGVTIISPTQAQKIAAKFIEQSGATPGTPDLVSKGGKKVYVVPVMLNNNNVGEIDLNAQDGSNLGGAGGVKN